MKLISNICPHCGAEIYIPQDAASIHCMYCGCHMSVERDPSTEEQIKLKEIDARIIEATAKIRESNARMYEANIIEQRYCERKKSIAKNIKYVTPLCVLIGMVILISGFLILLSNRFDQISIGLFLILIPIGLFIVFAPFYFINIENDKKSPEETRQIKKQISELKKELEKQQEIFNENSAALIGKKAQKKKIAKERIAELKEEIEELKMQLDD